MPVFNRISSNCVMSTTGASLIGLMLISKVWSEHSLSASHALMVSVDWPSASVPMVSYPSTPFSIRVSIKPGLV